MQDMAAGIVGKLGNPVQVADFHFARLYPGRRLQPSDVARHHAMPNGIVESVREQPVRVNDGSGRDTTLAAVPARGA